MKKLYIAYITTPIGTLGAIAHNEHLLFLQFTENSNLIKTLKKLELTHAIIKEKNSIIKLLETELIAYFKGSLEDFKTPTKLYGTDFQQQCWRALQHIPYGSTTSYKKQAEFIHKPQAHRAVANANKNNPIALIYPCHRIIKSDGSLCGYNGGTDKKQALLQLEKNFAKNTVESY